MRAALVLLLAMTSCAPPAKPPPYFIVVPYREGEAPEQAAIALRQIIQQLDHPTSIKLPLAAPSPTIQAPPEPPPALALDELPEPGPERRTPCRTC